MNTTASKKQKPMKNMTKHIGLQAIVGVLLLCLPVLSGCQKNSLESTDTIRLKEIRENSAYASLPLIGTKWQLVGFVDEKRKTIKLAKPDGGNSYTLLFKEDGYIEGNTSTNGAHGQFITERDNFLTIQFSTLTEINETGDGMFYIESMKKVSQFEISKKGLALMYDRSKYMLFQPY
jgi:hypothetical protein